MITLFNCCHVLRFFPTDLSVRRRFLDESTLITDNIINFCHCHGSHFHELGERKTSHSQQLFIFHAFSKYADISCNFLRFLFSRWCINEYAANSITLILLHSECGYSAQNCVNLQIGLMYSKHDLLENVCNLMLCFRKRLVRIQSERSAARSFRSLLPSAIQFLCHSITWNACSVWNDWIYFQL